MELYREVKEVKELMVIKVGSYSPEKKQIIGAYVESIKITKEEIENEILDSILKHKGYLGHLRLENYEHTAEIAAKAILELFK